MVITEPKFHYDDSSIHHNNHTITAFNLLLFKSVNGNHCPVCDNISQDLKQNGCAVLQHRKILLYCLNDLLVLI